MTLFGTSWVESLGKSNVERSARMDALVKACVFGRLTARLMNGLYGTDPQYCMSGVSDPGGREIFWRNREFGHRY
jgi:hypothetical protein